MYPICRPDLWSVIFMVYNWTFFNPILDFVNITTNRTSPFLYLAYPKALRHWKTIGLADLVATVFPSVLDLMPLLSFDLFPP